MNWLEAGSNAEAGSDSIAILTFDPSIPTDTSQTSATKINVGIIAIRIASAAITIMIVRTRKRIGGIS
jgi:hypothetical protein